MRDMATLRWTPESDFLDYEGEASKVYRVGEEYVGIPYTMGGGRSTILGDPLEGFRSALAEDDYTYVGPTKPNEYLGCDCSSAVHGAWMAAGKDTQAVYTGAMIPGQNPAIKAVGDIDCSDTSKMTQSICASNGQENLFQAYACLLPGDALVRRVPSGSSYAGHVRLVEAVDIEAKTVTVTEQCGYGIDSQTRTTWRLSRVYAFASLFANSYLGITPF